jgi:hypothetical protein
MQRKEERRGARRGPEISTRRGFAAVLLLAGICGTIGGAAPEDPEAGGLKVVYKTRGALPTTESGESRSGEDSEESLVTRQEVLVDDSGQRLLLLDYEPVGKVRAGEDPRYALKRKLILRMDKSPPVIYEVFPDGKHYREHDGDLNDLQKDRRIAETNEIRLARTMPRKEREAFFKKYWWLKEDGARNVEVKRDQGDVVLGRPCERVQVLENGRRILDIHLAEEKAGAKSYFHLYRRLGAFSEEVLEKIRDLTGIPLKGTITVVTALPTRTLEVEAVGLERVAVHPDVFELPSGAVRVDEVPDVLKCGQCGKVIDASVDEVPAKGRYDGKWVYFCSEKCAFEYARSRLGRP